MFSFSKLAAFILFSSIYIQSTVSDSKFSLCDKRNPHTNKVEQFRCPEETNKSIVWFPNFSNTNSLDKRIYCCGNLENRFCCKKSQHKKELYIRQRSEYINNSRMGGLTATLIVFAVFAVLICICCRCISLCCRKKRMNHGVVISSAGGATGNIDGQNVHVISQPQYNGPNQYPGSNNYPPAATQYQQQFPPTGSYPYPPTSNYNQQQPNYNQSSYINQPPPQYSAQPAYPNPYKQESSYQQSANEKSSHQPTAPSAPEF